ncbi:MAG: protein-glutamate O-methyltransferase CheR [Chloroflexi bacterium]|nr:protein-glutamate O-methyltransferase CheR [Chloroflexota bacterium]
MLTDLGYAYFQRTVRSLIGVDLSQYQQNQMRRRLDALMQRVGAKSFLDYGRLLERDPQRLQEFRDYFTINVSEFFRDADRFRYLESRVLSELLATKASLRIWSAGCSVGAEPYSVAMILRDLAPRGAHRILATDVDATILARARRGDGYTRDLLRQVTPNRLARYFTPDVETGAYAVKPEVKTLVDFREHNLLGPGPGQGFDLILCRNVVIYFTAAAKAELYQRFVDALRPGGILFVGGTEIVPDSQKFGLNPAGPSFYAKEPTAARPAPRLAKAAAR